MTTDIGEFRDRLREKGYKVTLQRMAIYEVLRDGLDHPTAEQVHEEVSVKYPVIGLSTVYNTLETLCQIGQVQKISLEPGNTRYDIQTEQHVHLKCLNCGKIQDAGDLNCHSCKDRVERMYGFQVSQHTSAFYGYCRDCCEATQQEEAIDEAC